MLTVLLSNDRVSVVSKKEEDLPTYYVEHSSLEYIAYRNDLELLNKLGEQLGDCYIVSIGLSACEGVYQQFINKSKQISLDALEKCKNKRYDMFLENLRNSKC